MTPTLMAESEEELETLDEGERGEWFKKLTWNSTFKKLIMASGPIILWWIDGEKNGNSDRL